MCEDTRIRVETKKDVEKNLKQADIIRQGDGEALISF